MNRAFGVIARVLVSGGLLLLLGACASPGGYGGYGGYPEDRGGYGQPDYGDRSRYGSQLSGTVDALDARNGRILLVVDDPRSGRTQRAAVRYDQRTRLYYQGRELAVEGLERGDVVRIDAAQSGRELWARTIEVVRDVRDGGYGRDDGYGRELRGTVAGVDARAGRIRLDGTGYAAGRGGMELAYDGRTTVEYQGRRYRPEDLERGDRVRVQARQLRGNQWLAERIIVERSVR
ncbi:DUF5666 domain-containing protein [Luteimonas terricola]|uniref:DUF5666 domain-containing protein n=1 Tax=Luteimonas terricola TaxID=645597 RepID=A0ABQ2EDU8_9GAMM|nr:DUF5666 domain-containing protein [Luteimonas terricola]GGK03425.1 hypothetical protein GCM10011394_10600 [Luteimonas terricola]